MKQWCAIIGIIFLITGMFGCASRVEKRLYHEPMNTIQREFYDVQVMYESRKLKETIELGEAFIAKYQRDILTVAVKYYIAISYQKIGRKDKAEMLFQDIKRTNPEDDWGKLATVGLAELKESRT
ncbi:MAG: hypothetical protein KKH94_01955 [Candidatus Omnitrophica bacterium]|nr:hypothetical protein [Candidatus Omnitrophota bacterium]